MTAQLTTLLAPRTIAVIGASRREGTMGHQILHNLIAYGFTGAVYPVNPKASDARCLRGWARIGNGFPTSIIFDLGSCGRTVLCNTASAYDTDADCPDSCRRRDERRMTLGLEIE
jgi:hypothetical protein